MYKNKKTMIITLFILLVFLFGFGYNMRNTPREYILLNPHIITANGDEIEQGFILIKDGLIEDVGLVTEIPNEYLTKFKIFNMEGKTIMPGVIDSHVHLRISQKQNWIKEGVTTLQCLGSTLNCLSRLKAPRGNQMPTVVMTGPIITNRGGYPAFFDNRDMSMEICGVNEARLAVKTLHEMGVGRVKIAITVNRDGYDCLSTEEIRAIVEEANILGLDVVAHINNKEDVLEALRTGVKGLAHLPCCLIPDDIIDELVKKGIWINTTLSSYLSYMKQAEETGNLGLVNIYRRALRIRKENAINFYRKGGFLALGTDFPAYYNVPTMPYKEMEMLMEAGFTPMEVIIISTRNAAYACGLLDTVGTIEVGKRANMLILEGNPLEDLVHIQNINIVIYDGRFQ